tara:strand:- start:266 stop:1540 length:1275 start_codon:yes stop_codon:yes gene_type:complete
MNFSIPEELRVLGITSKDFEEKRSRLTKSLNSEVNENDVIWELYKDLLNKAHNFEILQVIYWNMAVFKDSIGQNTFKFQQKSQQSRLLNLRQQGKKKVKINSDDCSSSCRKLHNLVFPISKALSNLPIPNPNCDTKLNSHNVFCKSIYLVAKDNELVSLKLPPPVMDLPKFPEINNVFKENKKLNTLFSKERKKNIMWSNFEDLLIPLLTFCSGIWMFFHKPIISLILFFWSIVFLLPLIRIKGKLFQFLKTKNCRYIIFGIGFTTIILSLIISLFFEKRSKYFQQKSIIPAYQILSMEDQSINSRSRLFVSIESPNAKSARERALVVMEAAKQIYSKKFSDKLNKIKYDYIFVTLEVNNINYDQNYVFAEAEFAPDRAGFSGFYSNDEQKWKWNVRSSNFRINHSDPESPQKVKETLNTFLLR